MSSVEACPSTDASGQSQQLTARRPVAHPSAGRLLLWAPAIVPSYARQVTRSSQLDHRRWKVTVLLAHLWRQRIDRETPASRSQYARLALTFLLLTAALSTYWSHSKLMDNDEFLSYYGDSAATLTDVVRIQLRYPISLDPPTYHLLSHLSMDLFGRNEMAMRVPALLGFLLFQASLFVFVRRMAGSRAAIVALLLPIAGTAYFYSVIGRPYGLLVGLYGMSLVCWQTAARQYESGQPRLPALAGISITLGLAITSHYFGVLILLPICFAEWARTVQRRRFDYGVLTAIFVGMLGIAIVLPFRKAVLLYQKHYYITEVQAGVIRAAYREIFFHYPQWPELSKTLLSIAIVAGLVLLAFASWSRYRRRTAKDPAYEWAALLAIAALPIFGYLFGRFVTHTLEIRYIMAWQFSVMACFGISLQQWLRRDVVFWGTVVGIVLAGGLMAREGQQIFAADRIAKLESMHLPPTLSQAVLSDPNQRIYVQSLENFFLDEHYEPDPRIRERFSYIYGEDQELGWLSHNTNAITAENLQHFTQLSIVPYSQFLADPDALLMVYHNGWEWVEQDLKARHRRLVFLGPILRGALIGVPQLSSPDLAAAPSPVPDPGLKPAQPGNQPGAIRPPGAR